MKRSVWFNHAKIKRRRDTHIWVPAKHQERLGSFRIQGYKPEGKGCVHLDHYFQDKWGCLRVTLFGSKEKQYQGQVPRIQYNHTVAPDLGIPFIILLVREGFPTNGLTPLNLQHLVCFPSVCSTGCSSVKLEPDTKHVPQAGNKQARFLKSVLQFSPYVL